MKTTIEEMDDRIVVTLQGEMDTAAAVEVEGKLKPYYTEQNKDVLLILYKRYARLIAPSEDSKQINKEVYKVEIECQRT